MKVILVFLTSLIFVWLYHTSLLVKVSRMEFEIKKGNKELVELQKEAEKKELEYNSLVDLEKIGTEMRDKKDMSIAKDIKFFRINE